MTMAAFAFANETRKGLLINWSYKFDIVTLLLKLSLYFVFISLVIGDGALDRERLPATLLGFIIWFYAAIGINNMSRNLMEEAQTGTLEQMYMTPVPTAVIMLGRSFASLVVSTSMVVFIGICLMLAMGIRLPLQLEAIPVFLITMVGLFGLGFLIAGATLLFKQTSQLANLVENFIMFLTGVLVPVQNLPAWLELVSRFLPTTYGILLLRRIVLEDYSLMSAWADGSLQGLALNAAGYFVIGWVLFKWSERVAKNQGSMGQY